MNIKKNIAVSESGFLFIPTSGDSFSLNTIGSEIIRLMKEHKKPEEIIEAIVSEYEVDSNTVEKDLYDFFSVLKNYKLTENGK